MAQRGQLILVRTDPATQFRDAASQNAQLTLNMTRRTGGGALINGYVDDGLAAGDTLRSRLVAIAIASVEDLDWEVALWASDAFASGTFLTDGTPFLGRATLPASTGLQIGGSGIFYNYLGGLDIPYQDDDRTGELHLGLIPRSGNKSAGNAGAVQLILAFEPTLGF